MLSATAWSLRKGIVSVWISFGACLIFIILWIVLNYRQRVRQAQVTFQQQQQQQQQRDPRRTIDVPGRPMRSNIIEPPVQGSADNESDDNNEFAIDNGGGGGGAISANPLPSPSSINHATSSSSWLRRINVVTLCGLAAIACFFWFIASVIFVGTQGNADNPHAAAKQHQQHRSNLVPGPGEEHTDRVVEVAASGSVQAFPDRVQLVIYSTTASFPQSQIGAAALMQQQTNALLMALSQQAGVPLNDITVQAASSQLTAGGGLTYGGVDLLIPYQQVPAYVAMQTVQVDTPFQADNLNALLGVLSYTQVHFSLTFSLTSATQSAQVELAMQAATAHALELATRAAKNAHATLGNLLSVDTNEDTVGSPIMQPLAFHSSTMKTEDLARVIDPLSSTKVLVSAQVVARYQLHHG